MGRKVFISFLGTGNYTSVKYQHANQNPIETRFAQVAIFLSLCGDFTIKDKVLIFTTKTANNANWLDDGHRDRETKDIIKSDGLATCFKKIGLNFEPIIIDEGQSEGEIWAIFKTVYESLNEDDEIIFDITHSFRTIPMLTTVLINYAKLLKSVTVKGIYYGAFDVKSDIKPIWDITSFSELQDWTTAVSSFVKFGNAKGIKELAQKEVLPILKIDGDKNTVIARELFYLAQSIDRVTDALNTNRGTELVEGKIFQTLESNLSNLSNQNFIPAFQPIIDLIRKKTEAFNTSSCVMNGFTAVQWAIDHDLIQQGYTMLQESIITYYCTKLELNFTVNKDREKVTSIFYALKILMTEKINVDYNHPINLEIASIYESLTLDRNDINHGGFSKSKKPENLRKDLQSKFEQVKQIINNQPLTIIN
jgi:CRISPR-associated Csx2 family protein